jgi:putative N6-adenine-specific DNA methylase
LATEPFDCFAIAAPGLEPIVAQELTALGERPRIEDGGVSWTGDAPSLMRANLELRTASRVVVRVARFTARAFFELEKRSKTIDWRAYLARGVVAEFRVTAKKSRLYHSDAIAERLQRAVGASAKSAVAAPRPEPVQTQLFIVRVHHDEFTVSVDSSGDLLHMRGYRQAVGKAPLRETLAAGLLLASGWDGTTALIDPMCGSGTIPIEAALLARRIAPGTHRPFAFMRWPNFDRQAWDNLRQLAERRVLPRAPAPLLGSDRDAGAIEASRANATRAGVADDIAWSVRPLSAVQAPEGVGGLLASNPPYGVRVSDRDRVRDLYARLGQLLRERFPTWSAAIFSPDPRLTAQLGEPPTELFRTTNGGIKVAALRLRGSGLEAR